MEKGIPNLSTISTIIERNIIENVKLSQFQFRLDNLELTDKEKLELKEKIEFQKGLTKDIRCRLEVALNEVFEDKEYDYYKENRSLA